MKAMVMTAIILAMVGYDDYKDDADDDSNCKNDFKNDTGDVNKVLGDDC